MSLLVLENPSPIYSSRLILPRVPSLKMDDGDISFAVALEVNVSMSENTDCITTVASHAGVEDTLSQELP